MLMITDANVLIDLEEGGLIQRIFKLPYDICTIQRSQQIMNRQQSTAKIRVAEHIESVHQSDTTVLPV